MLKIFANKTTDIIRFLGVNRKPLVFDAIFSDESLNFVSNNEPDCFSEITISIRTAADNCDAVVFCSSDGDRQMTTEKRADGIFDVHFVNILIKDKKLNYYFKIITSSGVYFYNKKGCFETIDKHYDFCIVPGFKTPGWAKGAVYYQIFVDRFFNGDPTNDVVENEYIYIGRSAKKSDWLDPVLPDDVCTFYGGDLDGVLQKLDYLKELGIEVIYFNPLFVSPSSHKYDAQDYDHIDPHFGKIVNDCGNALSFDKFSNRFADKYICRTTDKENLQESDRIFAALCQKSHELGIKIILDGVFNHCGAFHKFLDKEGFYFRSVGGQHPSGAYRELDSPYHSYFRWFDSIWPNNDAYDCWWGHDNHPKLNFEASKELFDYILSVGQKWLSPPYSCDGWRLDVAADIGYSPEMNHKFQKEFRNAVKSVNCEAVILAEHYGSPADWLGGKEWDSIMNYDAFMEPVTWFFTGMEKHSEAFSYNLLSNSMSFESSMRYHQSLMPIQSLQTAMNELSNHDHSRFLTRTNKKVGRLHNLGAKAAEDGISLAVMMSAVVMQMTWIGSPTVYYGDEVGLCGFTDPDNRRPFPWGNENKTLLDFHKTVIGLHKQDCIKIGSLEYLHCDFGIISFGRWIRNFKDKNFCGNQKVVVIINNNSYNRIIKIPIWKIEASDKDMFISVLRTENDNFSVNRERFEVVNGSLEIEIGGLSSLILENH